MRAKFVATVAFATAAATVSRPASAEGASCTRPDRTTVVKCALAASLTTRSERLGLESLEGKHRAASVLLPSNPTLALGGGYTADPSVAAADRQFLWSATLSQEVEIAGQRGKRLDLVSAEERAQRARVRTAERETATAALDAYFDALAAREEAAIAERVGALASALRTVSRARAEAGVSADLDAQLAEVAATRLTQSRLAAEQRVETTTTALATLLGMDPQEARPTPEGALVPLEVVTTAPAEIVRAALERRAEVAVAEAEREAHERRAALYERLRLPNPTFSVFVRSDWIGERSAGVGLGFSIPLPTPVGRTYAGEVAEATSLARRADVDADRLRRTVRQEVVTALAVLATRKQQAELHRPEQVRKTEEALRSIAEELESRRLPIREALLAQQGLIEYLFASVEARRAYCLASVEVVRVAGIPLEAAWP